MKRTIGVLNKTKNTSLGERIEIAGSFLARLKGLLGQRELPASHGLLLNHERSIHSFFMRFTFDAVFLDERGVVVHLIERMVPFRASRYVRRSRMILEVPAGTIAATNTAIGDHITFTEVDHL